MRVFQREQREEEIFESLREEARRSQRAGQVFSGMAIYGFSCIFSHLSYFSCLFSMISSLLVGLLHFDDLLV